MKFLNKFNKTSLILSTWLIVFGPLSAYATVFDKVVAKVNSEIITLSSVEERAELLKQKYSSSPQLPSEKELLKEALNIIVDEKLQIQEAKKIGFVVDEDTVDAAVDEIKRTNNILDGELEAMLEREGRSLESYKNHIRDQIIVTKISRMEIGNRVKVSEKNIIKYYKKHRSDLWQEGKVKARHILFIVGNGSTNSMRKEKFQLAKNVLNKIRDGNDFAELAMEYSEDISASNGGDVGFVERGKMVREFEDAVFSLKAGQVSGIVETEYGYHIIKVEEILLGKTLNFEESKDRINQILFSQKQNQAYEDWMNELKESAFIELILFKGTTDNASRISALDKKGNIRNRQKKRIKQKSKSVSQKRNFQKTWEEMYKSVEKTKVGSLPEGDSALEFMEEKLTHLKKLRDHNKISKREYQRRKGMLLNRF
jgi:parvulin-like peptidyl-prolyl isomerase